MRKDPLAGRPQATPPAADGAKLGDGPEGGRLLDFSGRQSRGWGRERGPPRHDYITIICILCGPIQVRISSINLTYINFTGIFDMSVADLEKPAPRSGRSSARRYIRRNGAWGLILICRMQAAVLSLCSAGFASRQRAAVGVLPPRALCWLTPGYLQGPRARGRLAQPPP